MSDLEKRMIEAGLERNSGSMTDYEKAKKLIKTESYRLSIYFICEYLNV